MLAGLAEPAVEPEAGDVDVLARRVDPFGVGLEQDQRTGRPGLRVLLEEVRERPQPAGVDDGVHVEDRDVATPRLVQSEADGPGVSAVGRRAQHPDGGAPLCDCVGDRCAPVGRGVVDDQDLRADVPRVGEQRLETAAEGVGAVVVDDDDRDQRLGRGRTGQERSRSQPFVGCSS